MKPQFTMTFDVTTEESASYGDCARHGFLTRHGELPATKAHAYLPKRPATFTLRRAVEILLDRSSEGPVEADSYPVSVQCPPRWFTYGGSLDQWGESVRVSMHLPRGISGASAMRIARLLRCYGAK